MGRFIAQVAAAVAAAMVLASCSTGSPDEQVFDPAGFDVEVWQAAVGGDDPTGTGLSDERIARLSDPATSTLPAEAFAAANAAAAASVIAQVTGELLTPFWPEWTHVVDSSFADRVARCESVSVDAANAQLLPGFVDVAKVLVVWAGVGCPFEVSDDVTGRTVSYVYVEAVDGVWRPVRVASLPGAEPLADAESSTVPVWALDPLDCAGDGVLYARAEVAAAWSRMCADAREAGVELVALDAYRSPQDQQRRFDDAVEFFGTEDQASRYVAESDGSLCASRHCAGEAVDVVPSQPAADWLFETVGCVTAAGEVVLAETTSVVCDDTQRNVPRSLTYGFAATLPHSPNHFDFVVPLAPLEGVGCVSPAGSQLVSVIGSVWRCRLAQIGVTGDEASAVVAEALAVAECSSGLDPRFVAFADNYVTSPHPDTGRAYDRRGLFAMPSQWFVSLAGVDADQSDAVTQAAAAAQMWVDERKSGRSGWDPFGCAVGDEFNDAVLPQFGGPPLPAWATTAAGV